MQVWCLNSKRLPREESLEITSVQLNLIKPNLSVWKSRLNVLIIILSKITLKFRNEIFRCNSEIYSSVIFITEYWIIPDGYIQLLTFKLLLLSKCITYYTWANPLQSLHSPSGQSIYKNGTIFILTGILCHHKKFGREQPNTKKGNK